MLHSEAMRHHPDSHVLFAAYSGTANRREYILQIMAIAAVVALIVVLGFVRLKETRVFAQDNISLLVQTQQNRNRTAIWPDPEILHNVAIANRLVVAAVNCGYLDFVDNWLASLHTLGITNYILIALDQHAYEVLMNAHPDHTILSFAASSDEKKNKITEDPDLKARSYGSREFGNVVRSRPLLLLPFLKQGFSIFYSDIDTYWIKNPFDEIRQGEYDMQAATDSHPQNPDDEVGDDNICTGMLYLEATYPSIRLLEKWHEILVKINADVNQASFSDALHAWNKGADNNHNVKIKYKMAERDAYPPGYMYFKNDDRWKNKDTYMPNRDPIIVHANWVVGKSEKRDMLKEFGFWKPTGTLLSCKSNK